MKLLDWIGRIAAWVGSLTLCTGVFVGSLFALFSLIGEGTSTASANTSGYSEAPTALPALEADAFDVRKVAAFLAEPRKPATPAIAAGEEQVRSIAAIDPVPATTPAPAPSVSGLPVSVGNLAVNLRAGPSKDAQRLATLDPGQPIQILTTDGGWSQVVTASGQTGWVSSRYLGGSIESEVLTAIDVEPEPRAVATADAESPPPQSMQLNDATVVFLSPPPKTRHPRRGFLFRRNN